MDSVDKVQYLEKIKNFAQLSQPYNKMTMMNIPAIDGVYEMEYISPDEEMELVSIVVTCSGYGENDYYNLYVNDELWFDTWFPDGRYLYHHPLRMLLGMPLIVTPLRSSAWTIKWYF